jgi:hypothetical protein
MSVLTGIYPICVWHPHSAIGTQLSPLLTNPGRHSQPSVGGNIQAVGWGLRSIQVAGHPLTLELYLIFLGHEIAIKSDLYNV